MKILSKYKDYYDYLSGVYGEDPKLILDRREFDVNSYRFNGDTTEFLTLYICGRRIDGVYKDGKFYYGDKIGEICDKLVDNSKRGKWGWFWRDNYYKTKYYEFQEGRFYIHILGEIVIDKEKINKKNNCPILLTKSFNSDKYLYFPILKDLDLASFIKPKVIYQWLVDWYSQIENEKEQEREISISNEAKILSRGFDLKTSFRPKMKK